MSADIPALTTANDKRRHERRALRSQAVLLLPGGQSFPVQTFDISIGGVGVLAPAAARVGTRLAIRVTLPMRPSGQTTFDAIVTVAHSMLSGREEGFKVGLTFTTLEPRAESAIRQYIALHS